MPVRLLREGGKSVQYAEGGTKTKVVDKEKDPDYLKIGDMELSRQGILDTSRDTGFTSKFFNSYKGFGGPKQREKIIAKRNQFINGVLEGKISLDGINTFVSNMPELQTTGKTKRRFLSRTYNTRDENTLNALGAAAALEVLKNSGYKPKEEEIKPVEGDTNGDGKVDDKDKEKYDTSFAGYLKSRGMTADSVASAALSRDENQRYGYTSQLFQNYLDSLNKAKESGKYNPETDWSVIDTLGRVIPGLKDKASYEANRDYIDLNSRDADLIRTLLGYAPAQQEKDKYEGLTEEEIEAKKLEEENQKLKQQQENQNLRTQNSKIQAQMDATKEYQTLLNDVLGWMGNQGNKPSTIQGYTIGTSGMDADADKKWSTALGYIIPEDGNPAGYYSGILSSIVNSFMNRGNQSVEDWRNARLGSTKFGNKGIESWFSKDRGSVGDHLRSADIDFENLYANTTNDQFLNLILSRLKPEDLKQTSLFGNPNIDPYDGSITNTGVFYADDKGIHYSPISDVYNAGKIDRATLQNYLLDYINKKYNLTGEYQVVSQKNGGKTKKYQRGGLIYDTYNYGYSGGTGGGGLVGQLDPDDIREIEANKRRWANQDANLDRRLQGGFANPSSPASAGQVPDSFDFSDATRIAATVANLTSAVTAFTGFSPVSTATGFGGTVANLIADWADKDVSAWDTVRNFGINAGLDLISLVPFAGTATGVAKAVKSVRALLPVISYVAAAYQVPDLIHLAQKAVSDTNRMTSQDWIDLLDGVNMLVGGITAGKNVMRGNRLARESYRSRINAGERTYRIKAEDKNGKKVDVLASPDEWNKIAGAKGLAAKQAAFKEIYGDDFKLDGNPTRIIDHSNEGYDSLRPRDWFTGPRTYNPVDYVSGRPVRGTGGKYGEWLSRFGNRREVVDPLKERGVEITANSIVDREKSWKKAIDRGKNIYSKLGRNKSNTTESQNTSTQNNTPAPQAGTQQSGTTRFVPDKKGWNIYKDQKTNKYYAVNKTKNGNDELEEITDKNLLASLREKDKNGELFKKGGVIPVGRFANGGVIYKYQSGDKTRNTFTADSPLDYKGYNSLWGQTTGLDLLNALKSVDAGGLDWDNSKFINMAKNLQGTYKGAVDVSGNGYDQTDINQHAETGTHQKSYNTNWARGNKAIEDAITKGIITRRGSTGDNTKGGYTDNLHGLMNSLRTWGYAASDVDRKAFESSDIYKQIRDMAARRGMVYKPIESLSGNGKYYYGFEEMPAFDKPKPGSIGKQTPLPQTINPNNVGTPGADPASIETESIGATLDPTDGLGGEGSAKGAGAAGVFLGNMLEPILKTRANNRATRDMVRAIRPNRMTAYRTQTPVENDYFAKRAASNRGAQIMSTADKIARGTADASLGAAAVLQGQSLANQEVAKGDAASRERFYKTRQEAMEHENANTARWTAAANANVAAENNANITKAQLNAQNRINNISGIWGPWMREQKAIGYQMANDRMQADIARSGADMAKELAALRGNMTDEEWNAYLTSPEYAQKAAEIRARYQSANAGRSLFDYVNPIFTAKKGMKIKTSYEVNRKGMDEWSKNFFRNELKAKSDDTKRLIASSSGWMNYMKMLSDNVNQFNRVIKYAPTKRYK